MSSTLTNIQSLAQQFVAPVPTLVIGSGLSCAAGMPSMWDLQQHLESTIETGDPEKKIWTKILSEMNEHGLEESLTRSGKLPDSLSQKIARNTWNLIADKDWDVFDQLLSNGLSLPLSELITFLLATTHREIDVVTTNYDRLIEFAAESAKNFVNTGFTPGYFRNRTHNQNIKLYEGNNQYPTVNVWKVHGSVDWFHDADGTPLCGPIRSLRQDQNVSPLIVTPGIEKNIRTHIEPFRTIMTEADNAMMNARAYICIGFGFRDSHIEPKLIERLKQSEIPIVVLAMKLTNEAKSFLKSHSNQYLAIEKAENGSRCFYDGCSEDGELIDTDSWSIEGFMKLVS